MPKVNKHEQELLLMHDITGPDWADRRRLKSRLAETCRQLRQDGLDGHFTYDKAKHFALYELWKRL